MVKSVCVWKTCLSHVTTRTDVTKNVVGVHVNDKKWPGLQAMTRY